jgi:hypothetical protein
MIASRHSLGVEDLCQFFGFSVQRGEPFCGEQTRKFGQLNPKCGFVGLFQHRRHRVDEVRPRFGAQGGAIVGCDRRAAARDLIGNGSSRRSVGQTIRKLQNADGELHGSLFKFGRVHRQFNVAIAGKSSVKNHQS